MYNTCIGSFTKQEVIIMQFIEQGTKIRSMAKELVLDFMKSTSECDASAAGLTQAEIFRACGMDWGEYPNATSTNQQYWIVALLRELESECKICRDPDSKKWRIK